MPIPQVTCSADVILSYSASPQLVQLNAVATESPTAWAWTILSVPAGSTAASGVKGDFNNGVAAVQNPQLLIDGAIDGGYTVQCVATNGSGPSDPTIDRYNGQQLIIMRTQKAALWLLGDWAYDWGQKYLDKTLRLLETTVEVITGANVGASGVGIYKQKSGTALQFKKVAPGSAKVTITDDTLNDEVDIDINPSAISHQALSGAGSNTHTDIDNHIASSLNPHGVTKTQVSLGNVTDDAQLKRAANDFSSFSSKPTPVGADRLLLEDSAAAGAKKYATVSSIAAASVREDEFATLGTETPGDPIDFALSGSPRGAGTFVTPSGYDLSVFRNGVRMKYNATPAAANEYMYLTGTTEVRVVASGGVDDYVVYYSET